MPKHDSELKRMNEDKWGGSSDFQPDCPNQNVNLFGAAFLPMASKTVPVEPSEGGKTLTQAASDQTLTPGPGLVLLHILPIFLYRGST